MGTPRIAAALCGLATICLIGLCTTVARADPFGELAKIGKFGTGPGEFDYPVGLATDPQDNSVFVVDEPGSANRAPSLEFRIQEFPVGLAKVIGTAMVATPGIEKLSHETEYRFVGGVAVDSLLHRLYLLIGIETEDEGAKFVGNEILVYSTEPSNGELKPEVAVKSAGAKAGVAYEYSTFPEGTAPQVPNNSLLYPEQIAVDPNTHELIVLGQDTSHNALIQRIKVGAAQPTSSYDDTTDKLSHRAGAGLPTGLSVGPDGSIYVMVKSGPSPQAVAGVMKVAPDFSSFTLIHEGVELTGGSEGGEASKSFGSQIAVSPEESGPYANLVYAFQVLPGQEQASGAPPVPGSYEVRGMSTATGTQEVAYGGEKWTSTASPCVIATNLNSVVAGSNGIVYALDNGTSYEENGKTLHSPFGFDLVEFGPGGQHCPEPATSIEINTDKGVGVVKVQKGEEVKFDATGEQLHNEQPTEVVWKGEGPEKYEEKLTGAPAETKATHRFLKLGLYTITLRMKVSPGTLGSPPPVTREIEVTALPPIALFEASSESPKPGETITFDASKSIDPNGSAQGGATNELKSYTWNFGDGSASETTSSPTTTHVFANTGNEAKQDTVTLTVTNKEEVQSASTSEVLTIQGTPTTKQEKQAESKPHVEEKPLVMPSVDRSPTELSPGVVPGAGVVKLTLSCPVTKVSCAGTVLLKATVKAKRGRKPGHVTLGQTSFNLSGGQHETLTMRLSASGLALLTKERTLKTQVMVEAHDPYGDPKLVTLNVTLHASKTKKGAKKKHA